MAKSEVKTRPTDASVTEFLKGVDNDRRRTDAFKLLEMFSRITGEKAVMWGPAIVGFGSQMLKYANGSELAWPEAGFSPRKACLTLYVICKSPNQPKLFKKLGKHTSSVSCLYIKNLADVDEEVLEEVIADAFAHGRNSDGGITSS